METDRSVTFDLKSEWSPIDKESIPCPKHSDRPLHLFCSFCKTPICTRCKATTHIAHLPEVKDYDGLKMAAKRRRDFILNLASDKDRTVVPFIKSKIVEISESQSKLVNRVQDVIREYRAYTKNHWDKLKLPEDEWIGQLRSQTLKYQQLMEEKTIYLKELLLLVQSTIVSIKDEVDDTSVPEILLSFATWRSKLDFLLPPKWPRMEIQVDFQLETVPAFGSRYFQDTHSRDQHCNISFINKIIDPLVYTKVFDMKMSLPKAATIEENATVSITSGDEMFIAYGGYIMVYSQDNRRTTKSRESIHYKRVVTVKDNIIDMTCDQEGRVFFITKTYVSVLNSNYVISRCVKLYSVPSAICATKERPCNLFVGFSEAGMIHKYSGDGEFVMKIFHPDFKMLYHPRYMTTNVVNDVVFTDGTSNVSVIGPYGKLKHSFGKDSKTGNGTLRPSGIACASERHIFMIDENPSTQLHIFDESGTFLQTAVFRHLENACALNIDRTGDIWVIFKDGKIRIYRPEYLV